MRACLWSLSDRFSVSGAAGAASVHRFAGLYPDCGDGCNRPFRRVHGFAHQSGRTGLEKGNVYCASDGWKILSVFLAWLVTRLHLFHRIHPLRPKWMLLVSLFPLTSLFMLMALFLICRDQRDLTQPVAFFCIFLGIANVAIVYVVSLT